MATADGGGEWRTRLEHIVGMLQETSRETDPQALVRTYLTRIRKLRPVDRHLSLSRRGLRPPCYRITRSSTWTNAIDPWREPAKLPVFDRGLLGDLLHAGEPRLIDDLEGQVALDDPAAAYLEGMRSLSAIPHYLQGDTPNMVVTMKAIPHGYSPDEFPDLVLTSNLFGRATQNLVLSEELREALGIVERELRIVADLQRSLLPKRLPTIEGLDLAAHYQTSQWAGGDYYDLFPLPGNRWGLMIADVSGHGTPAAVMMAVTHSIAHSFPGEPSEPAEMLAYLNQKLAERYTSDIEAFVTAFYGVLDPARRALCYASAGHNPPRLKRCEDGSVLALDRVGNLPLGIMEGVAFDQTSLDLRPGDQIVFHTDGITEATAPDGHSMYGTERLDEALAHCHLDADGLIRAVLDSVDRFTQGAPPTDDRTLIVAKVS